MPTKLTLYPKTRRVGSTDSNVFITEKIDGSNLTIFKLMDQLYFAQRNYVFSWEEVMDGGQGLYKGLHNWCSDYGKLLMDELHDNAAICGEWIGMGKLQYPLSFGRFMQFAKANVTYEDSIKGFNVSLKNIYYDRGLFKWSYKSQEAPDFIQPVPLVGVIGFMPTKSDLDNMYTDYVYMVDRMVEGLIVIANNNVQKYVRMKNGELQDHKF